MNGLMKHAYGRTLICGVLVACFAAHALAQEEHKRVLRVHPKNPRYLTDDGKRAIFLAGSHTWATIQERGVEGVTPDFNYTAYLNFMQKRGHNFLRLWAWEHATWMQFAPRTRRVRYKPTIYERTGPGKAVDGEPKFDLTKFNEAYFKRLRDRAIEAGKRDIFCSVMLFQGFSIEQKGTRGVDAKKGNPWDGHPFNSKNNINGIDGDANANGEGEEVHKLKVPAVTRLQEAYVRKVIDTLGDLDHILWEVVNESHFKSVKWQLHMTRFIKEYEVSKGGKRHLVWMSILVWRGNKKSRSDIPPDVVSPWNASYLTHPKAADGRKIVIVDTDHISPWKAEPLWVWKNLLRGNHYAMMDSYRDYRFRSPKKPVPALEPARKAIGYAVALSQRVDLARMTPRNDLASTKYCLANPGVEYLVLQPGKGPFTVHLPETRKRYAVEWVDPLKGTIKKGAPIAAAGAIELTPPFDGHSVLRLTAAGK